MCRGSAADLGSTPGPGPFAACHSPSLTLFPVYLFTCTIEIKPERPKKYLKKKKKKVWMIHRFGHTNADPSLWPLSSSHTTHTTALLIYWAVLYIYVQGRTFLVYESGQQISWSWIGGIFVLSCTSQVVVNFRKVMGMKKTLLCFTSCAERSPPWKTPNSHNRKT